MLPLSRFNLLTYRRLVATLGYLPRRFTTRHRSLSGWFHGVLVTVRKIARPGCR